MICCDPPAPGDTLKLQGREFVSQLMMNGVLTRTCDALECRLMLGAT